MRKYFLVCCMLLSSVYSFCQPLSGTYTVLLNGANGPNTFGSLTNAVDSLKKYGVMGPVIFSLVSGVHTGQYLIPTIVGSSLQNNITFKSNTGNNAILSFTSSAWANNFIFKLDSTSFINFTNLTFTPTCVNGGSINATFTGCIAINNNSQTGFGATNISIVGCVFNGQTDPDFGNETDIIHCFGPSVKNILIDSCQFINGAIDICLINNFPNPTSQNISILNNSFSLINTGFADAAISIRDVDSMNINNNNVTGLYSQGIAVEAAKGSLSIQKNRISNSTWQGLAIQGHTNGTAMVAFNFLNQVQIGIRTLFISNTSQFNLFHNTVSCSSFGWFEDNSNQSLGNIKSQNNIFANFNGGLSIRIDDTLPNWQSINNCYFTIGNILAQIKGIPCATLANIQSLNLQDVNSIFSNPIFVSNSDSHLSAGSPCIGTGLQALPGLTDIDNDALQNPPCIGADEFIASATLTAGLSTTGSTVGCLGDSIVLHASPSTGFETYVWFLNGIVINNFISDSFIVTQSGTYSCAVSLNNDIDTSNLLPIIFNTLPFAAAGVDQFICNGSSIVIGGTPSAGGQGVISFSWGPNIAISNILAGNPTVSPTSNQTYTITVIDGNNCISKDTVNIVVQGSSQLALSIQSVANICAGIDSVNTVIIGGIAPFQISWVPNSGITTLSNGSFVLSPSFTTLYTISISDSAGCISSTTHNAVVANNTIVASANDTICINNNVGINVVGGVSYSWLPNQFLTNDTIANPVASPNVTTMYYVTGITSDGCNFVDSVLIFVRGLPLVTIDPVSTLHCIGDNVPLQVSGANSYLWSPATNLSTNNVANPICNALANETYIVTGTDSVGCVNIDSVIINITTPPVFSIVGSLTLCDNESAFYQSTIDSTITQGQFNYSWLNSQGVILSTNAGLQFTTPNSTFLQLMISYSSVFCEAKDSINIQVLPSPILSIGNDTSVCTGSILQLSALTLNSNATVSWLPTTVLPSSSFNPLIAIFQNELITCTISIPNGCSAIDSAQVVAVDSVLASFTSTINLLAVQFTNTSTNANTYAWDFGDGSLINIQPNPNHNYMLGGNYLVQLIASNICGADTFSNLIFVEGLGLTDIANNQITIFPSPINNQININSSYAIENITIKNMLGKTMYTAIGNGRKEWQSEKLSFEPGIYIIIINNKNVYKLIKQ